MATRHAATGDRGTPWIICARGSSLTLYVGSGCACRTRCSGLPALSAVQSEGRRGGVFPRQSLPSAGSARSFDSRTRGRVCEITGVLFHASPSRPGRDMLTTLGPSGLPHGSRFLRMPH